MLTTTLSRLRCPHCTGALDFSSPPKGALPIEVRSGQLICKECQALFLILAGVALLVRDTYDYLIGHVKGISKVVPDHEIPIEFRDDFLAAKEELEAQHIEEDLEAERVNSLYLMNHYLRTKNQPGWWRPSSGVGSPLVEELICKYWDQGPFAQIEKWVSELAKAHPFKAAVELGCGVGGLHSVLRPYCEFYLGVDSSFASIALARHIALGAAYPGELRIPEDLLKGSVSRAIQIPKSTSFDGRTDFIVMDFDAPAIEPGWDLNLSLNMMDMLDQPEELPRLQSELLVEGGIAIQSCPYIWHERVAQSLREMLPHELQGSSALAVEWLYRNRGFEIEKSVEHLPWLFFKHLRQLEIYSVHLIAAKKSG